MGNIIILKKAIVDIYENPQTGHVLFGLKDYVHSQRDPDLPAMDLVFYSRLAGYYGQLDFEKMPVDIAIPVLPNYEPEKRNFCIASIFTTNPSLDTFAAMGDENLEFFSVTQLGDKEIAICQHPEYEILEEKDAHRELKSWDIVQTALERFTVSLEDFCSNND